MTGGGAMAQQSRGEFTPSVPTKGACDAPLSAHAKSAEIRRRTRVSHQPRQPRPQPLQQTSRQDQPHRRWRRGARPLRGITASVIPLTETGSNSSDSTATCPRERVLPIRPWRPALLRREDLLVDKSPRKFSVVQTRKFAPRALASDTLPAGVNRPRRIR